MTLTRSRRLANLAIAIDSAASSAVLKKVTDSGEYVIPSFTDVAGAPTTLDSSLTSQIIDSSYVQLRQTGGVGNALDSAHLVAFADSNYITARFTTGNSGFKLFRYDATANQTTFEDSDKKGNILAYNPQGIIVFYNGVALLDSAEYTATDGTSVVLDSAASLNAKIQIASWNIPSSGGGGATSIAWGGSRGVFVLGHTGSAFTSQIDYFDITTSGNAQDFGDLSEQRNPNPVGSSSRCCFGGGVAPPNRVVTIDYITTSTTGNATDFGDLSVGKNQMSNSSNGIRGLFVGGYDQGGSPTYNYNVIEYITIATTGNVTDFGDTTTPGTDACGLSNGTYGLHCGGYGRVSGTNTYKKNIDKVTIATTGNATNFGNLSSEITTGNGVSDDTRGVIGGGYDPDISSGSRINVMEYVTISTDGNATDFGDLTVARSTSGSSHVTYGCFSGGGLQSGTSNTIDRITIQTTGNATDHGDLTSTTQNNGGWSGNAS